MAKKYKDKMNQGKSDQAPGHLKKEAGEQSAKPFAPGHQEGSAKESAPGQVGGKPNASVGAPPPKDDYEGANSKLPTPPKKKSRGVGVIVVLVIFVAVFIALYFLSGGVK